MLTSHCKRMWVGIHIYVIFHGKCNIFLKCNWEKCVASTLGVLPLGPGNLQTDGNYSIIIIYHI